MDGWTPLTIKMEVKEKLKTLRDTYDANSFDEVLEAMVAYVKLVKIVSRCTQIMDFSCLQNHW